jgi:hypothetical protein
VPDDVGPGELDEIGAAGRVGEHPVVVRNLLNFPK